MHMEDENINILDIKHDLAEITPKQSVSPEPCPRNLIDSIKSRQSTTTSLGSAIRSYAVSRLADTAVLSLVPPLDIQAASIHSR